MGNKIDRNTNFAKLKSKHLAISVFSGQRVFWGNERKYFPHIPGLRTFRGSLYHIQFMLEYLVCIFRMLTCIFSKSSCLCTCPSSLAFCISWLKFCRCIPHSELIFYFLKYMLARPVVFWGQGSTWSYQKVAIMQKHYYKLLFFGNKRTWKIWGNLDFEIDFWKSDLSTDLGSFW